MTTTHYKTTDIAKLLGYSGAGALMVALKNRKTPLLQEIHQAKLESKLGRNILWLKEDVDLILKRAKIIVTPNE